MATIPENSLSRPPSPLRQKLAAFWRWWVGEIGQLLPERFAGLRGASRVPVLATNGEEIVLLEPRSAVGPDSRVELAGLDEARRRAAVRALLERAGESRSRARVCLDTGEALVRRVTMPAATEENLRQVLAFEMDRLTPFRAEDVYFDYRVVSRDAAAGQIHVQLGVARRELVDARVEALRGVGASVQGVTIREDLAQGGAPFDLLPLEQRGERETSRERLVQRVLLALVVLLAIIALLLPVYHKREAVISTFPAVSKARQDAEATDAITRDLEKQVADYNFLLAKKHGSYPVLAYLEEVTRLLPDNTWLQQMDIKTVGKAREIQLSGETTSSSKLIEVLEQSRVLKNAAPRGTVTRGSQPNTERFMIAAEPQPRAQPEATAVIDIPVPVAPAASGAPAAPATLAPATAAPPKTANVTPVPAPAGPPGGSPGMVLNSGAPKNPAETKAVPPKGVTGK
jgi:general secretion pathway protein L